MSSTSDFDLDSGDHLGGIRFTHHTHLRFLLGPDGDGDTKWISDEKAGLHLSSFLHYASRPSTDRKHTFSVVAGQSDGQQHTLSLSKTLYSELQENGRLPLSQISWFEEKGQFGRQIEHSPGDGTQASALSIWLRSPDSFIHEMAICMRIDIASGSVLAVYFDRNEDRIDQMFSRLHNLPISTVTGGFFLLSTLLDLHHSAAEQWRSFTERRIRIIEGETGAHSQKLEFEPDKNHGFNFGRLTMSTQNLNTGLVSLEHVTTWQSMAAAFVSDSWTVYEDLRKTATCNPTHGAERLSLLDRLQNQASACALSGHRVAGAQKRMQSQISILLSLISQRDNRTNILLAQESRELATAAKQDSKVMRVIAVLTLVFLPATLIASIFSTGIFNIGELGQGSSRISPLWWVYAVASTASTVVVVIAGYMFLRLDATRR